jgi:argininosuccinate lyase
LTASLALLKGLPLGYNRDLQEDKAALFDGLETTRASLTIAARVVGTLTVHAERMKSATALGFLTATDLADELVRRGIPFADAHEQVGKLVRHCVGRWMTFADVADAEARGFIPSWDSRLRAVAASPELSVARRDVTGGTSPRQVARQLRAAARAIKKLRGARAELA